MGKASISIDITSSFNGSGLSKASQEMQTLASRLVAFKGNVGNGLVELGTYAGNFGARLEEAGARVEALGNRLTWDLTIPITAFGDTALTAATDVDTAFYGVRKTVDMTEAEFSKLYESTMAMSKVQPVSAETLFNIQELGGQLGVSNSALLSFSDTVSKLDVATNINAETASLQLAQFANITNMAEENYSNFAATLVDLGNNVAAQESSIMNLGLRFASAGHIAGMSQAEILGLSASLAALGMNAESGGSALSQVINKINLDVANGTEAVQKWAQVSGKSADEFVAAWRDNAANAFADLMTGIATAGEDTVKVIDELGITSIRQSDAVRRLANDQGGLRENLDRARQAWVENTAAVEEFEKRSESIQSRFDVLKNNVTAMLVDVGRPLAEALLSAADAASPLLQAVGDIATAFNNADPAVQRFVVALGAIAAAAGPVLKFTGSWMQTTGQMIQGIGRATQGMGVLAEAYKTTNYEVINSLNQNKTWTAQLGLSRNATIKAAGGLDQYMQKVHMHLDATEKSTRAEQEAIITAERRVSIRQNAASATEKEAAAYSVLQQRTLEASKAKSAYSAAQAEVRAANREAEASYEQQISTQGAYNRALREYGVISREASKAETEKNLAVERHTNALARQKTAINAAADASIARDQAVRRAEKAQSAYNKVVDETKKSTADLSNLSQGYQATKQNEARISEEVSTALKKERENISKGKVDLNQYTAEVKKSTSPLEKLKSGITGLGTAFAAMGPMLAVGGVIAGITALAAAVEANRVEAERYTAATSGMVDAVKNMDSAFAQASGSVGDFGYTAADSTAYIEMAKERNIAFTESVKSITDEVSAEIGMVEAARDTLHKYYGQADLTKAQQAELAAATDILSDSIDGLGKNSSGQLFDEMTGDILETADAVDVLIDKFRQQAEAQARMELYKDAYKNYLTDLNEYGRTTSQLAANEQRRTEILAELQRQEQEGIRISGEAGTTYSELKSELLQLEETDRTLNDNLTTLTDSMNSNKEAAETLADGIGDVEQTSLAASEAYRQLIAELESTDMAALRAVFSETEHSLDQFAQKMLESGVSFSVFGELGITELTKLANGFDGTTQSIIATLYEMGGKGREAVVDAANSWKSGLDEGSQGMVNSVTKGQESVLVELFGYATQYGDAAQAAIEAYRSGVEQGLSGVDLASHIAEQVEAFRQKLSEAGQGAEETASTIQASFNGVDINTPISEQIVQVNGTLNNGTVEGGQIIQAFATDSVGILRSMDWNNPISDKWTDVNNTIDTGSSSAVNSMGTMGQGMSSNLQSNLTLDQVLSAALVALAADTGEANNGGVAQAGFFSTGFSDGVGSADFGTVVSLAILAAMAQAEGEATAQGNATGQAVMEQIGTGFTGYDNAGIGTQVATQIGEGINNYGWDGNIGAIVEVINGILGMADYSAGGQKIGTDINTGFDSVDVNGHVSTSLGFLGESILMTLGLWTPQATFKGQELMNGFGMGISLGGATASQNASTVATDAGNRLSDGAHLGNPAGVNLVSEYAGGISGSGGIAASAANAVVVQPVNVLNRGGGRARSSGTGFGSNWAGGIRGTGSQATSAGNLISNQAYNPIMLSLPRASQGGRTFGGNFSNGVSSMQSSAGSAGNGLANAAVNPVSAVSSKGHSFGSGLGSNLAAGIRSQISAVRAAATALAEAASAPLHHSTPKVGPLHGDDKWGGHMVDNIVHGMQSREGAIRAESDHIAQIMSNLGPQPVYDYADPEMLSGTIDGYSPRFLQHGTVIRALTRAQQTIDDVKDRVNRVQGGETYNFYFDGVKLNDDEDIRRVATDLLVRLKTLSEM